MHVAVVMPFRGDAEILGWVLQGFAEQTLPESVRLEVRVCGDGMEVPASAIPSPNANGREDRIRFIVKNSAARLGVSEAKNILLRNQPADIVILANADARPAKDFVAAHISRLQSLPQGTMVLGAAPYEPALHPTVFDALREETPMIFFYPGMKPNEFYDYRHAWTLNLSLRYCDLEHAGFFADKLRPYGYEDLDLGFRLLGPHRKGIYFDPAARVLHRHPMTFDQYLDREESLGAMTPVLHAVNPDLFENLQATRNLDELAGKFRTWCAMDAGSHAWIYRRMTQWCELSAAELGTGEKRCRLLMSLYQMHIPLKRLAFRLGMLRGMDLADDARWTERGIQDGKALWRRAIALQ